jgi:hypothetical protein
MDQDTNEWKAFPSLEGATGWLNSQPLTVAGLRGTVVLVDFWTYTCINWLRSLPYVRAWADKYWSRSTPRGAEAAADWDSLRSPENYLGHERTWNFASPGGRIANRFHARDLHLAMGPARSERACPARSMVVTGAADHRTRHRDERTEGRWPPVAPAGPGWTCAA